MPKVLRKHETFKLIAFYKVKDLNLVLIKVLIKNQWPYLLIAMVPGNYSTSFFQTFSTTFSFFS
jgi:uncharacterized membrane protein